jgi:hypothetical protein
MKIVLIILYFAIFAPVHNITHEKTILVLGRIKSGKSCLVNAILGRNMASVGKEDLKQTTKLSYTIKRNIEDLNLNLKIKENVALSCNDYSDMLKMIKNLTESGQGIDLILLLTSLKDENPSLILDLEKIKYLFSDMKGVSLIVTKTNDIEEKIKLKKLENINKISEHYGLNGKFIVFDSECDGSFDENLAIKIKLKLFTSFPYSSEFLLSRIYDIGNKLNMQDIISKTSFNQKLEHANNTNHERITKTAKDDIYFEIAKIGFFIVGNLFLIFMVLFRKKITKDSEQMELTNKKFINYAIQD